MIRRRTASVANAYRKTPNSQNMTISLLMIVLHCAYFTMAASTELLHSASPGVAASVDLKSAGQAGIRFDSAGLKDEGLAKDGSLLSGRRGAEGSTSGAHKIQLFVTDAEAKLDGHPALSDVDLIAKDKSILGFTRAYAEFEDHNTYQIPTIITEKLHEEEKFQLYLNDMHDRLVINEKGGSRDYWRGRRRAVRQMVADREMRSELLKTIDLAQQQSKSERWWMKLYNVFLSHFKRDSWKQYQASLRLSKLRRGFLPSEEIRTAVFRLSIFARQGPNFTERELKLIENISHDISDLTAEDEALITEISSQTFSQRKNTKAYQLLERYHQAFYKASEDAKTSQDTPTLQLMKERILEALKDFRLSVQAGVAWTRQDRQLFEMLERMKDMKNAPQNLFQDKQAEQSIVARSHHWRRLGNRQVCAQALAILEAKSQPSPEELALLGLLKVWWDEGKLSSDDGVSLRKFNKEQLKLLEENSYKFGGKMLDVLNVQTAITARNYLDQIGTIEKDLGKAAGVGEPLNAFQAFASIEERAFTLLGKKEQYLNHLKNTNPQVVPSYKKLYVDHILETGLVPEKLIKIANGISGGKPEYFDGLEHEFYKLRAHLRKEEKGEINRLIKLSSDDKKFEYESKFVKVLGILTKADARAEFDIETGQSVTRFLDLLSTLKEQENRRARLRIDKLKEFSKPRTHNNLRSDN
ncbi:hypothetical protein PSTG_13558 [Puccinia striiformis f. sp. tritici PST-78]|uniref:Uncharacterized protein n=1 Tax=Puccinia striiformis f. sp. tritici PST-78 TaxID=1165861 RepID=A0A0L0V1K0_9BASI|nr:hypothetical protein PSTG_13558 [Puccinia striiformis f. sp. tritici PST-78]